MASRSLSRELALLVLGQVSEQNKSSTADLGIESLLDKALESLTQHWREALDSSATELDQAQQRLLDSELQQGQASTLDVVRDQDFCYWQSKNKFVLLRWNVSLK